MSEHHAEHTATAGHAHSSGDDPHAADSGGAGQASHAAQTSTATADPPKPLFTAEELSRFEHDDHTAGRAIGKMLALFFFYTVIVMSIVAWWTVKSASQ